MTAVRVGTGSLGHESRMEQDHTDSLVRVPRSVRQNRFEPDYFGLTDVAALATRAGAIVTGDEVLCALGCYQGIPVLSPADCLRCLAVKKSTTPSVKAGRRCECGRIYFVTGPEDLLSVSALPEQPPCD